jgi:uncharacterized protein YuzE
MRWTWDPAVDALTIELAPRARAARTTEVLPGMLVDQDAQGRAIAIELLDASARYDRRALERLAAPTTLLSLGEAARAAGLDPTTLRHQIARGRLTAIKRGRDWWVPRESLRTYLVSRGPQGRRSRRRPGRI